MYRALVLAQLAAALKFDTDSVPLVPLFFYFSFHFVPSFCFLPPCQEILAPEQETVANLM